MSLAKRTMFVSGGSRGIGLAIALRAARDGANVTIAAKTGEPHKYLPGTIYTAAEEIEAAGGKALPLLVDVRDDEAVADAIKKTAETFGGIDIVVNNASAISRTPVIETQMKRWDLMLDINARGSFSLARAAIPYLKKSDNAHVLTLSPPLNMDPKWFSRHVAYTISKYTMSMVTLGMAEEFRADKIAFNSLWPRYGIATAAIEFAVGDSEQLKRCRTPDIMADAAHAIFSKPANACTGNFFIDDTFLHAEGEVDLKKYKVGNGGDPRLGMFIADDDLPPPNAY